MTILENYPKPSIDCLMNFISTHDISRAITILGGDSAEGKDKDWQSEHSMTDEQYQRGRDKLKCAMVLQYFLPGVPSIYYGDEAGMQGYCDPFNRRCYPWGSEDGGLLLFVRELGAIRRKYAREFSGRFEFISLDNDCIAMASYNADESGALITAVNKGDWEQYVKLPSQLLERFPKSHCEYGSFNGEAICLEPKKYSVVVLRNK